MNIMDFFDGVTNSLQSIFRNKRRSTAMISGIILGVSILSGIIIYTDVLQQENFESIVSGAEYEVSFNVIEAIHGEDLLWEIGNKIKDDIRVESSTVITGPRSSLFSVQTENFVVTLSSELESIDPETESLSTFTPLFVRENYTSTSISEKLTSTIIGKFDVTGTEQNKTVIPEILATQFNLQVGSVIDHINITVAEENEFENHGPNQGSINQARETLQITNVLVTGIYSSADGGSNIFANFAAAKLYFNTALLDKYGGKINSIIKDNKYQYLAVKINSDEFTVTDLNLLNTEINTFINDISELATGSTGDTEIVGTNEIAGLLGPFEILNVFLIIFDVVLVLPLVVLCLYLLSFGLQLALEERRREIGVFKVQGANSAQIFRMIRNEGLVLFSIGAMVGYIASIFGAWVIGSATGFMEFDMGVINQFDAFISFNTLALVVSILTIFSILLIAIYKKGREFINLEVSEAVQRGSVVKKSFFRRNNLDIFMVIYGLLAGLINILQVETLVFESDFIANKLNFDPTQFIWSIFIDFLGIIFLWIGAAVSGARIAKWLPQKTEKTFLSLPKLRNVGLIIRSGLKRRGDIDNLVLIIVMTLSITTLAGVQGVTDFQQQQNIIEYQVGADFKIVFTNQGNYTGNITQFSEVEQVMELPSLSASILSSSTTVYGMDPSVIDDLLWHETGFDHISLSNALADFKTPSDLPEIMIGNQLAEELSANIGDEVNIRVRIENPDANATDVARLPAKIIATFDHAPGGVDDDSIVAKHDTVTKLRELITNTTIDPKNEIPANTYLINVKNNVDRNKLENKFTILSGYTEIHNSEREISEIGQANNYGIPGLLTMMYLTSLVAAIISAFAFSAIIMERRKREFAVLQTVGAQSSQIYITAFGENFLIMLTSVFWGILAGLGLSYMMNGFIQFIGSFLGRGDLPRTIIINWEMILLNGVIILAGMLIATLLSVISSVRQDLTEATRTI